MKPASSGQVRKVVRRVSDAVQWTPTVRTRLYFEDKAGRWHVGLFRWVDDFTGDYVLQVPGQEFIQVDPRRIHVRWRGARANPRTNLGNHFLESPLYHNARRRLVRALGEQRARAGGMTGLLSASVELYPHQVEVVRRVLQDPVLRYLLADEVGLGKTIEAGAIIRQYHLDRSRTISRSHTIAIVVPPALTHQWRHELATRFQLDPRVTPGLRLLDFEDVENGELPDSVGLLVVDEAHHVARPKPRAGSASALIQEAALSAPSLLLLSATPALHNEAAFLTMLHMLDPTMYDVSDVEGFQERLRSRTELAEAFSDFHEGADPDELEEVSALFREMFPADTRLANLLDQVDDAVEGAIDVNEAARGAVRAARVHIGETYRLHRRVLRNRRGGASVEYPVRGRSGLTVVRYVSSAEIELDSILENWRLDALVRCASGDRRVYADAYLRLLQARLEGDSALAEAASEVSGGLPSMAHLSAELREQALELSASRDRVLAFLDWLREREHGPCRIVVFADETPGLAEDFHGKTGFSLFRLHGRMSRVAIRDVIQSFEATERSVLLCDEAGEEGVNLQFADHLVHWNLPASPNRIEQRMGRLDRHNDRDRPAVPVTAFLPSDADASLPGAWLEWLDGALCVFDRSASSLQFFLDGLMPDVCNQFFDDGPDGVRVRLKGDRQSIDLERRTIARHQNLDAIEASMSPAQQILDRVREAEVEWRQLQEDVEEWVVRTLQARRETDGRRAGSPVRYQFPRESHVPKTDLGTYFSGCLSVEDEHLRTTPVTAWMTFDRGCAVASGTTIARPGSDFLESLTAYLDWDDRGTAYAMLRFRPGVEKLEPPPVVFRFDFVVSGQARTAADVVEYRLARKAVERRMDELFPPLVHTVWIDQGGRVVADERLLAVLREEFRKRRRVDTVGWDFDLGNLWSVDDREPRAAVPRRHQKLVKPERRRRVKEMAAAWGARGPVSEYFLSDDWDELCLAVRNQAQEALREQLRLAERCETLAGRAQERARTNQQQLEMRAELDGADHIQAEIRTQAALYAALVEGVRNPSVRLDAVGVFFLTGTPLP
ncbi:MAG: hypothetical protein EP330_08685 [Deltaproteobacteria bacterium]|nr:MAG: hypothetical protein EP330_08685 [Deltaproteobacteria bacterium]